ncbi:hypothetical protein CDD80_3451 [Ophiocordyceps camponoti-rufipedis]|uniref:Extracellular membrane protein CFEM domain-containing protein n=1 Tax=Ophiocordyceps camponoti-rufipedis TaxID=2004952 RepID=A0A2C5Z1T6_9HYPO|nr:hypothetical protein CDD80_3451 [Ophiocordyceps camponoti-rufipedis]
MKSTLLLSTTLTLIAAQSPCAQQCAQVSSTETSCSGGTLSQHASCLCNEKPFFQEWADCRTCLRDEKREITADEFQAYSSVLASASSVLCGPSPTASFQALFIEASAARNRGVSSLSSVPSAVSAGDSRVSSESEAGATAATQTEAASTSGAAKAKATGDSSASAKTNAEAAAETDSVLSSTTTRAGVAAPTGGIRTTTLSPSSTDRSGNSSTTGTPSISGASAVSVAGGLVMAVAAAALAL